MQVDRDECGEINVDRSIGTPWNNRQPCRDDGDNSTSIPIVEIAKLTQDETVRTVLRARMFAELARYVAPRAKAADLTGSHGGPLDFVPEFNTDALSTEELQMLQDLMVKVGT